MKHPPSISPLLWTASHYLHQLHTATSFTLCLKNSTWLSDGKSLSQYWQPGQDSWEESLHTYMFTLIGCLLQLCLRTFATPGASFHFHLQICFASGKYCCQSFPPPLSPHHWLHWQLHIATAICHIRWATCYIHLGKIHALTSFWGLEGSVAWLPGGRMKIMDINTAQMPLL